MPHALEKRQEALQVQLSYKEDDDSPGMEVLVRLNRTMSCIKLASVKKICWVIVIADALLKGTECPTCSADFLRKSVASPGTQG